MALYVGLGGNLTEQALVDTNDGQVVDLLFVTRHVSPWRAAWSAMDPCVESKESGD